ncbi:MAG: hypothetical protein CSA72_04485 [Rhodobacterales bacterium]|nr:MAG: hypothetical protein CSA72_04485 [Rhodobacterales bacterium]
MTARTAQTFAPPVMEARRWLDGVRFPEGRPLLNVSQAAPVDPPPAPMRAHMARLIEENPDVHLYGPVLGLPALREAISARWNRLYGASTSAANIAITSGCNEAFTATLAALCGEGDEVIAPTPWYFNHAMACDMAGVRLRDLPTGDDLLPDPERAASLITSKTRAILLISPNNPGGVEYPAELLRAFLDLARARGIKLVIDETYRDFHSVDGAPHGLFTDPDWDDTLIQLYSFSKSYRLTGHRVGAITASADLLSQMEKYLDTVTICPAQLGQHAALWGIENLDPWLAEQRGEILARGAAMRAAPLPEGWRLRGCGAYFAWLDHPFNESSATLAPRLVREAGVLLLPGTMFKPKNDPSGAHSVRIAFANVDATGIATLAERLSLLTP